MKNKYEMDMCHGNLLKKMVIFTLPLLCTSILQLLYNAADMAVVGRFAGSTALAAVGSTTSLINLFLNLFINISVGVGVNVAQCYGAGDEERVNQVLHTAVLFSIFAGIGVGAAGFFSCRSILSWMGTPAGVIGQAEIYMKIFFLGAPANILYNFGAAAMRSIGDTRRPLIYLTIAGLANVALNLFFVIVCNMEAEGVALATILSQVLSAVLVVRCLMRTEGCCRLELKKLRIHGRLLGKILKVGLPAGLQSAIFSVSNVLIQSAVNSFGATVMAGNSIAYNLEHFSYAGMNAVNQAGMCFIGQNVGGKQYDRIRKITLTCVGLLMGVWAVLGGLTLLNGRTLLGLYTDDPAVVDKGMIRLFIMVAFYFLCGLMELFAYETRGMGQSVLPMICSIFGACVLRVIWIYTVFVQYRSLEMLYIAYPVTWTITLGMQIGLYFLTKRRLKKRFRTESLMESR